MNDDIQLAVVVPVYNEEKNLESLINDWHQIFAGNQISYEFIIINDGSKDNSLSILNSVKESNIKIPLTIYSQPNQGHGAAILNGYQKSLRAEWVFQIDADHQLSTDTFVSLWNQRPDYDFLLGERKQKNASISRKFISAASKAIVRLVYGGKISDVNSPYRLMRSEQLKKIIDIVPKNSFAPNILITSFFIFKKAEILTVPLEEKRGNHIKLSKANFNFLKGCVKSMLQTILFRSKL
ncbi:MAG: glycosyltransferase family 2 protein [Bacteroidetes bacterium]|nr:glycosyltransferase family 2 protein [Bacteroidota bacterium]